ncbi:MAG: anti-sigma factor family protein [Candidatus Acidiferrales bacterium]
MDWNCTNSEERLSDYLDGQLTTEEGAAYAAHAATCARCSELVAQVGGLVSRMHQLEEVAAPPQLVQKILDATLGPRTKKASWKRWFTWAPVLWQPRFAMGALTVAASFVIVFHTAGVTPAKLRKADLSPANIYRSANRQIHLTYARGEKFVSDLRVVYEIESRLQPGQEPASAPVVAPPPDQHARPQSSNPQEKSEKKQPHDRTQVRSGNLVALLLPQALPLNLFEVNTRSKR